MPNIDKLSKNAKLAIAVVLQLAVLLVIVVYKLSILAGGTSVLLHLAPVDPHDPLRGDYLHLRYDISTVNSYSNSYLYDYNNSQVRGVPSVNQSFQNGDTIYIPLQKSGKFWVTFGGASKSLPSSQQDSNNVYIKGTVVSGGTDTTENNNQNYYSNPLTVSYNIEDYFVPQGKGNQWNLNSSNMYAQVVVDAQGNAVLKQLYLDDKRWP